MGFHSEIFEQSDVLARLLDNGSSQIHALAAQFRKQDIRYCYIAARGTSDHAALYAKYVLEGINRLPVALAAPSLFSVYDTPPSLRDALVIGISQSGQSPDIVQVLAEGQRQAAPTLAITNDPASPLAAAAEWVIDIGAGDEKAVAASKTYTATLMAVAMLSAELSGDSALGASLRQIPDFARRALAVDAQIAESTERFQMMESCVVLGRGYHYATAREWALKLKELSYVVAEPYSPPDFRHGPIAMAHPGFPVLAVAPGGPTHSDMIALLKKLITDQQVTLLAISNMRDVLKLADVGVPLPDGIAEWLAPLVSIIPAQLFVYHLTRNKGLDTDAPRGLNKITRTI